MSGPKLATADLEQYLAVNGWVLSDSARALFLDVENIARQLNVDPYAQVFLIALLKHFTPLTKLLIRQGLSPEDAAHRLEQALLNSGSEGYSVEFLYSDSGYRVLVRAMLIDHCLEVATRRGRTEIGVSDVLEALLEQHDEENPVTDNHQWTDEGLHVAYNTLSHIGGRYDADLWIAFDDVRRELSLVSPAAVRRGTMDRAPQRLRSAVAAFMADHPDYRSNCFIIMPFRATAFHNDVIVSLRKILRALGFNPLRADDKVYSDEVLANIETYLYGCHFGVAVHDRFLSDEHNANVALEVGYCLGMGKPVCLLKEQTVHSLPSDMQGRIYVPFDGSKIEESVSSALTKWLVDSGLRDNPTAGEASLRAKLRLATGERSKD